VSLSGQFRAAALVKAGLAPAVKDSIHKVVGYGLFLGDQIMALLAFPHLTLFVIYLLEHYSKSLITSKYRCFDRAASTSFDTNADCRQ
jgi:hypothetical protein